jgi:hypothetical protein
MKRPSRRRQPPVPETARGEASEHPLRAALATLEQCRNILVANGSAETARLLSMAILQLRMELNGISESELKVLCDALLRRQAQQSQQATSPQRARRRSSNLHS